MVDQALLDAVKGIRENGLKEPSDALKMFELAKALSVESEDMKEEIEDMDLIKVGFVVNDKDYQFNVTIGEGRLEVAEGAASDPSVTLSTTMENWGGMLSGEADATSLYMSGELKIDGNLQDAIAFGEVLNIMQEELEDME